MQFTHIETMASLDTITNATSNWTPETFIAFYNQNKEALDKIPTVTLNLHANIYDSQNHLYKVVRDHGNTKVVRVGERLSSRQRDRKILEILQQLAQLQADVDELRKNSERATASTNAGAEMEEAIAEHKRIALTKKPI